MPTRMCFGQRCAMSISHSNEMLYMKSFVMLKRKKMEEEKEDDERKETSSKRRRGRGGLTRTTTAFMTLAVEEASTTTTVITGCSNCPPEKLRLHPKAHLLFNNSVKTTVSTFIHTHSLQLYKNI